jgi:hypothetical protein
VFDVGGERPRGGDVQGTRRALEGHDAEALRYRGRNEARDLGRRRTESALGAGRHLVMVGEEPQHRVLLQTPEREHIRADVAAMKQLTLEGSTEVLERHEVAVEER